MQKALLSIILLLLCHWGYSQLSLGVNLGYAAHGVYLEPNGLNENQVPLYLPSTGLVLSFNNTLNAGLQMEFNYAPKGWREEVDSTDAFFERRINYLEIPFYSHFEIGYGKVRPVIMAGPYFGFKLSESSDSLNYTYITSKTTYNQYYEDVRDVDFGIKIILGLRYNPSPKFGLFLEGRYDIQMAGGRDIFYDKPNEIAASRLKEIGLNFGILWHIIPQEEKEDVKGYAPRQDLYDEY